jgi:hypothetical protein
MKSPDNYPIKSRRSLTQLQADPNKTVLQLDTQPIRSVQNSQHPWLSKWMPTVISTVIVACFTFVGLWITRGQANSEQQASSDSEGIVPNLPVYPRPVPLPSPTGINLEPPEDSLLIQDPDLLAQGGGDVSSPSTRSPQWMNSTQTGDVQAIVMGILADVLPKYKLNPGYENRIGILLINNPSATQPEQMGLYQESKLFYPASVVKMFWMVNFYNALQTAPHDSQLLAIEQEQVVDQMIRRSDNNMASRLIDVLTHTSSQDDSSGAELDQWIERRNQLSELFRQQGYSQELKVGQKTFPITKPTYIPEPRFNELKMRGNPDHPIRNAISAQDAAQLLNRIVNRQAIQNSDYASRAQQILLLNDSNRTNLLEDQDTSYFNPVRTFFSEGLSDLRQIDYYGKAGWTSSSRNEVAYIIDSNKGVTYILAVFTDGKDYAEAWKLFPDISRYVHNRMGS